MCAVIAPLVAGMVPGSLGALAAIFDVDGILAAFAAGLILRRAYPDGDKRLESKLDCFAFGLLVPIFFVTSGMAIDVSAVVARPGVRVIYLEDRRSVAFHGGASDQSWSREHWS